MKRKRKTAEIGISVFLEGMPPSDHACGGYGGPFSTGACRRVRIMLEIQIRG